MTSTCGYAILIIFLLLMAYATVRHFLAKIAKRNEEAEDALKIEDAKAAQVHRDRNKINADAAKSLALDVSKQEHRRKHEHKDKTRG